MLQGLLKMWMLKIISEGKVSGYQIIKKVNELTGKKPSTGSVYPLLKSMQNKGWIIGKKVNGKTIYEISDSGKKVVMAHGSMKDYYEQKISGSLSLAHDTFNDLHVTLINNSTLINPIVNEVSSLLAHGVAPEKINTVLSKTLATLQKLKIKDVE
jgi:DNA-binding PadR family transcriptional regulator